MEPKISGGYILLSRKIVESEIWGKPPLYIKVWIYLLSRAQHADYKSLKKGQLRTSIPEIQKACSYRIGFRKITPTYKQIRDIIAWLSHSYDGRHDGNTTGSMKGSMIGTTKGTHGMVISIDKYSYYQNSNNYEGQYEGQNEGIMTEIWRATEGHNINKNDNKNEQECNTSILSSETTPYSQIKDLFNQACTTLPKIKAITENRKKVLKTRWKEHPDIGFFKNLFYKVNGSDFLSGRNEKWKGCCFDWIMKPANLQKIIEGNYDNKNSQDNWEDGF